MGNLIANEQMGETFYFDVFYFDHFSEYWEITTSLTWIAMLAGVFILFLEPPKSERLNGRGQTK